MIWALANPWSASGRRSRRADAKSPLPYAAVASSNGPAATGAARLDIKKMMAMACLHTRFMVLLASTSTSVQRLWFRVSNRSGDHDTILASFDEKSYVSLSRVPIAARQFDGFIRDPNVSI